jgi:hypothetical protein
MPRITFHFSSLSRHVSFRSEKASHHVSFDFILERGLASRFVSFVGLNQRDLARHLASRFVRRPQRCVARSICSPFDARIAFRFVRRPQHASLPTAGTVALLASRFVSFVGLNGSQNRVHLASRFVSFVGLNARHSVSMVGFQRLASRFVSFVGLNPR